MRDKSLADRAAERHHLLLASAFESIIFGEKFGERRLQDNLGSKRRRGEETIEEIFNQICDETKRLPCRFRDRFCSEKAIRNGITNSWDGEAPDHKKSNARETTGLTDGKGIGQIFALVFRR
jgi:hypothetical protein